MVYFYCARQKLQTLAAYHLVRIKQLTQQFVIADQILHRLDWEAFPSYLDRRSQLSGKGLDNDKPLDYFLYPERNCLAECNEREMMVDPLVHLGCDIP